MAQITVNYSSNIKQATLEALENSNLKSLISPGMKVSLKPNLVLGKPASSGATTHPEIAEALISYLRDHGVRDIEIIESSWVGDDTKRAFRVCGYEALGKKAKVPLFDLKDDKCVKLSAGEYDFEVCKKALDTDFLINIPVLKAHCQTLMTCCLKNMKGVISDMEKRRFHAMGLHRPIAFLNKAISSSFSIIDGICGDLTFEEGGTPVARNMIIAAEDSVAADSYCAALMGFSVEDIEYLSLAAEIGAGRLFDESTPALELNSGDKPIFAKSNGEEIRRLSGFIAESQACSACYSALVFALNRCRRIPGKISVGQGFKGKSGALGCGNCTCAFDKYVKGCPPKAVEILEFLKAL
ncbi:MAG: DUF362 domain-containing protein [Clostridiales bacterium]|jgi:uncharacterized protein (DUF362 family)|nr:DUF362 domain-containing protein [Clostridiales bacterium]